MDTWKVNPFGGPGDVSFLYANELFNIRSDESVVAGLLNIFEQLLLISGLA